MPQNMQSCVPMSLGRLAPGSHLNSYCFIPGHMSIAGASSAVSYPASPHVDHNPTLILIEELISQYILIRDTMDPV